MTQGKVREATRYVTRRFREGGVIDPNAVVEPASKNPENLTVFEMLKQKHPTATLADPSVFPPKEEAESLSPLPKVIITDEHIRAPARTRLKGSAKPDGIHSTELQRWLLTP